MERRRQPSTGLIPRKRKCEELARRAPTPPKRIAYPRGEQERDEIRVANREAAATKKFVDRHVCDKSDIEDHDDRRRNHGDQATSSSNRDRVPRSGED